MVDKTISTVWIVVSFCISLALTNELARGWGDHFDWMTLEEGLKASKAQQKPLMLVIHKSWCGACNALKPKFAESEEIKKFKDHFIFVNTRDDEEPKDEKYSPDGGYIPRVLFIDPNGDVNTDFFNQKGNENYKYYYFMPDQVAESMEKVLKEMSWHGPSDEL